MPVIYDTKGWIRGLDITNKVCPTITAGSSQHFSVTPEGAANQSMNPTSKPPYRVPLMTEIETIPWNGLNTVSTFSGTGGSCLGYRMAGFRVLWASEFVPAAQDSYRLNHPDSILDTRDLRQVSGEDIRKAIGNKEVDLLDGSPPCASFSFAGKREANWGKIKTYSDTKQRTDDLFWEFARIAEQLQPKTFVAENVSGLVKGTAKGYFKMILARLKGCGYRVTCRVLDAKWLGVPQSRARTIFIGVRNDLELDPVHPTPLPYLYTVREALPWIVSIIVGNPDHKKKASSSWPRGTVHGNGKPCPTVVANGFCGPAIVEAETDISKYAIGKEWDKLWPGEASDKYFSCIKTHPNKPSPTIQQSRGQSGIAQPLHPNEKRKFTIAELKRLCAFPDDFQLTGTYAQQWERLGRAVPPVMMAHIAAAIRDGILLKGGGD